MRTFLVPLFIGIQVSSVVSTAQAQNTTLTNKAIRFTDSKEHWVKLSRNNLKLILVDNAAIDIDDLADHRAGYSGIAKLTHSRKDRNVFVPGIAGLNFEHIHDGTSKGLVEKFEPRKFPMELRIIDQHTVELYQPPTGNWKLESCGRYRLLADDTIEYTFECVPRENKYSKDFIGLFWASYINQPEDKSIYFSGRPAGSGLNPILVNGITPRHGVASTHRPGGIKKLPPIDSDFPLTLVNHPSEYEYSEPWYYGVSHGMALVQMFRPDDRIWLAQSPSGGGNGNPAWDFQWFIKDPKVGESYRFVMRMAYLPFENHGALVKEIRARHKKWLSE